APAQGALADWASRVGAYLLDAVLLAVPWVILFILGAVVTVFFTVLSYLVIAAGGIWFAIQVGQCGSSPGMRVIGLRCVGKTTGQPIGAGMGFVRGLCHIVDSAICFIGWLWPLWDPDKQTLADKVMSTVVVKVPPQAFSLAPSAGR
ncbi:MAG TPA: RDD family protein, partial [Acidimicrobiales bacterium]|nr:RDD family protein [Acidimicrobiales bacterium]